MRCRDLCRQNIPALVVCKNLEILPCLRESCQEFLIPLLRTPLPQKAIIERAWNLLEEKLRQSASTTHGVLLDIFGIGVLLLGKSGIGKSETALELVMRGHRLVADDIVEIRRSSDDALLLGTCPQLIKYHLEIRGLGILNLKDLLGSSAVMDQKRISLAIELVPWDEDESFDRLGVDKKTYHLLDVEVPYLRLPLRHGGSMATIIEVAARNQILKIQGHHSAKIFSEKLSYALTQEANANNRHQEDE